MELRFLFYALFMFLDVITVLVDAACKPDEWTCADGSCIDAQLKCNGGYDCRDKSDETFVLCLDTECSYWEEFRCAYRGCLKDKSLVCNGVPDCIDNSDELIPRCRNDTTYHECTSKENADTSYCYARESTCKDGTKLKRGGYIKCDGKVDCEDGSDETLEECSAHWIHNCIGWKFVCKYGGCVERDKMCNGVIDCADGSDELEEICEDDKRKNQFKPEPDWNCKDGNRIKPGLRCDGRVDCPDGSDETIVECRSSGYCPFNHRRCVYGACVRDSLFCNGHMDCADNSDELLHECRNETTYTECVKRYAHIPYFNGSREDMEDYADRIQNCQMEERLCDNGQLLQSIDQKCDGRRDCADGSDETLENCSTMRRECGFRCRTGGCIDAEKVCDKVQDCSDGTDELDALCFAGKCVLPEFPAHGNYTVQEQADAKPGQMVDVALLVFSCDVGYKLHGTSRFVNCLKGNWPYDPPQCLAQCKLPKHPSTTYWCLGRGPLVGRGEHQCGELVPSGATVRPECSASIYHFPSGVLTFLYCEDGVWNRPVPTCSPQCGLLTANANKLIINGTAAVRGELPWYAAIYSKRSNPYEQVCGGSLISKTIVISAAHCFWSDFQKLIPVRYFAVALGKIYRPWNDPNEADAQKTNVRLIKIPSRYKGLATNLQDDIALVFLSTPAQYRTHVLPVCLDFSPTFERRQLVVGNFGKVAGWGLTSENGKASPVLLTANLPYIDVEVCYDQSPPDFAKFITSDKICAGNANSTALCQGDSGGGLVFASRERGEERYFLRGVVSAAPRNEHICNSMVHTTFTLVSKHQAFILESWNSFE